MIARHQFENIVDAVIMQISYNLYAVGLHRPECLYLRFSFQIT